ncbi:MAG: lipid-A-disaccharide synthase [Elusimicrobiales bacterium]|nr:lipid-A-disaccharide synthase [Elusimicrobiales bacterium]
MPKILRNNNILFVAGDVSGDLHASNLALEIKKLEPSVNIYSIGGLRLKEVSDRFLYDLVSKGSFGFVQSFKSFGLWIKMISIVRRFLEDKKPAFVVLVDFYGFNRQVLGLCKNRDIPAYYYIPPQVWASRPKRAETISKIAKEIFAIFPFEPDIYKKHKGRVSFFGHPLLDLIPKVDSEQKKKIKRDENYEYKIGILPGSRKSEIENHLNVFVKSFLSIKNKFKNAKGYIFAVKEFEDDFYHEVLEDMLYENDIRIVRDEDYSIRSQMDFSLTCSGTATLENALLSVPMAVGYKTSFINYEIAKAIINIPYISLANIISSKEVVKEFIQNDFKADRIADYAIEILKDEKKYSSMIDELSDIRKKLGEKGVNEKIAKKIISDFEII